MDAKERLYGLIDEGYALVFPTEESARAFSVSYVRDRRKGLLAGSAIAFDTFQGMFYGESEGRREADDIDITVFSHYAAARLSGSFTYFSSASYPEVKERMSTFMKSMLASIDEVMASPVRRKEAHHDAAIILGQYRRYLDALSLSDRRLGQMRMPALGRRYALLMPKAFPKERRLASFIAGQDGIAIIDDLPSAEPVLESYANEKSELRSMFIRIRELAGKGVDLADIIISSPSLDRVRPYLEKEAYLHSIRLAFVSGSSPLESPAGSFLSSLRDIYQSHYQIDALKSLFLNPAMPFRHPEALRAFIGRAIADSIAYASGRPADDRYARIEDDAYPEAGRSYRAFRRDLDRLMAETRPRKAVEHLHTLMSHLLKDEQFSEDENDRDMYSFAMDALSSFAAAAERAAEAGFPVSRPIFPAFISYLEGIKYVPRKKAGGVRVYPFGQDAAIPVRFRFIIGLNENDAARVVKDAPCLSDYEVEDRPEDDITAEVLKAYGAMTGELHLSASQETYSGSVLPLMKLARRQASSPRDDLWRFEGYLPCSMIFPLQKEGYSAASASSFRRRPYDEDVARGAAGKPLAGQLRMSFSKVDKYRRCPFAYAMEYGFGLDADRAFVIGPVDHLEIGSRLHSVFEAFYEEGGQDPDERIPAIFDEVMALWQDGKILEGDGTIRSMRPSASRPSAIQVISLRRKYVPNMVRLAVMMNSETDTISGGTERKFVQEAEGHGYILEGKADRIASSPSGGLVIYDYKKGSAFSSADLGDKSLQFYIYRFLAERELHRHVERAAFVTIADCRISDADLSLGDDGMLSVLDEAADGMRNGRWIAIPDDGRCGRCGFRTICRRRFSVQ